MPDWDAKYAAAGARLFGEGPTEYVRAILARSDFQARSALCLADGDGRNGAWLAGQGLTVTAVDLSARATELAQRHDAASSVTVERLTGDLADWTPPPGQTWEAVFLIHLHCEPEIRNRALRIGADALTPGGWMIVEGFAKAQAARDGMGPKDPALFYALDELEDVLPEFEVVEALAGRVRLDEGPRHQGEAEIVRFAARKAASGQAFCS